MARPRLPDKVSSQMRIEPSLFNKLKAIAAREGRSMNSQVEYFIRRGVEGYEASHGAVDVPEESDT